MRQTRLSPRSTQCGSSPSPFPSAPVFHESEEQSEALIIDTSFFASTCPLPQHSPVPLDEPSPRWSPASPSGRRSPFSPSTSSLALFPSLSLHSPPKQTASTPSIGYRLDSRPSVPLQVTVTATSTVSTPVLVTPIAFREPAPAAMVAAPQPTLEAALSNLLLSSGLSASRRFSYPPTVHSFAPSPKSAGAVSDAHPAPPSRVMSPGLMSPTAASTLFEALDRKRAFRPYRPPTLSATAFHRLTIGLTFEGATAGHLSLRLFHLDAARAALTEVAVEQARVTLWAVGLDDGVLLLHAEEEGRVGVRATGVALLSAVTAERESRVRLRGVEDDEEWEVAVEVKAVESFSLDDAEESVKLMALLHESRALRQRVEAKVRGQRESKGGSGGKVEVNAGALGEVKV